MRTIADCRSILLNYIDEATKKGVALPSTKNADYVAKFNTFLYDSEVYIANMVKIPAVMTVTQNAIPNQLGLLQGFDLQQYLPGNDKVLTGTGTKSYYFEVDNLATISIKVNGVVQKTINNTIKGAFTAYKGNITALATDIVTITFTGNYPFNIRNTALYAYSFATDADVPDYKPYIEYALPSDFMSFDSITMKSDPRVYEKYIAFKWEIMKKIVLNYYDKGSFDIYYNRYPAFKSVSSPDTTPMDIEDRAIDLVVLDAGVKATTGDNKPLSAWLLQQFNSRAMNIINTPQQSDTQIQTIYSIG